MTQIKQDEVVRLMSQMDSDMQNYVIDTLRHLKFAQDTLSKKNNSTYAQGENDQK